MKVIEEEPRITVMDGPWNPESVIREVIEGGQEDPFYVMDMGEVVSRYQQWKEMMPRVEPFYAVKCNDDKMIVSTLAALGAGFDCASKVEIELVTKLGVGPDRIIFANPAKMASHIRHASAAGVTVMTFDSETELGKIKQLMPHAQLVIRIRCDAAAAQCPLGIKFGCDPDTEAPRLLKLAAAMGLQVIGVSFHVGSGAREYGVYSRAIQYCCALFACGQAAGHRMRLIDLGGGFPGDAHSSIAEAASVINSALATHFPDPGVRVIAEPGRYFATAAYTLATMVYAKREIPNKEEDSAMHTMYFMNDGVYGSFNCLLYDHSSVTAQPVNCSMDKALPCSVWGPTCDSLDCVIAHTRLPPLQVGSWLMFKNMGAYTLPVASPFNGFPVPTVRWFVDGSLWFKLKELWPLSPPVAMVVTPPPSPPPEPAHEHSVYVECALK